MKIKDIVITIQDFRKWKNILGLREPFYGNLFNQNKEWQEVKDQLYLSFYEHKEVIDFLNSLYKKVTNELNFLSLIGDLETKNEKIECVLKGLWMHWANKKPELDFIDYYGLESNAEWDWLYGIDAYKKDNGIYHFFQFKNTGFNDYARNKFRISFEKIKLNFDEPFIYYLVFNRKKDIKQVTIEEKLQNF